MEYMLRRIELQRQPGYQTINLPEHISFVDVQHHNDRLWLFGIVKKPVTGWFDHEFFIIENEGDFPVDKIPMKVPGGDIYTGTKIYHVFELTDAPEEE